MSLRIDTSEFIPGACLIGNVGLGVPAENIAASGTDGPGYAYNDISLPADNGKEICGLITSYPSAGVFTAYEDTSFTFTGAPDGIYTAQYQLYVDGVATGSPTDITLQIGSKNITPGPGSIAIQGFPPTVFVSNKQQVNPGVGQISIVGFAPTVVRAGPSVVNPGVGALQIRGYPPTIAQTGAVYPLPGSILIQGYAPTVTQGVSPVLQGSGPIRHRRR